MLFCACARKMGDALKYATTAKEVMNVIVDRYSNWLLMERPVIVCISFIHFVGVEFKRILYFLLFPTV